MGSSYSFLLVNQSEKAWDFIVEILKKVLVPTMKKSFWVSPKSRIFPNILYSETKKFRSYAVLMVRSIIFINKEKPKIIILGSDLKVKQGFAILRFFGFFKKIKFVSINMNRIPYFMAKNWRKLIFFSTSELILRKKALSKYDVPEDQCVFSYLPADGNFLLTQEQVSFNYIFSGGGNRRDYGLAIEAVKGMDIALKIATFSRDMVNYKGSLPPNCQVIAEKRPLQLFLQEIKNSKFVVIPLLETEKPHGHTTIAQAMCLGKVVISTKKSSVDDYITHGEDGFLIEPGNVIELRMYINILLMDEALRIKMEKKALKKSILFSYKAYQQFLVDLCREIRKSAA